jgi:hypothetical protein
MISQEDFNGFVDSYNTDYLYLLTRAASGSYDCLITSFRVLKDLHDVILTLKKTTSLTFATPLHPLNFRGNDTFLTSLGFSERQIELIYGFLEHVKYTQGQDFEQCIDEGVPLKCANSSSR